MKTNFTFINIASFSLLLFIFQTSVNAQPKYDFRNASKISGTDRQAGALYRFPNVRTGVDALVTITAITGGLTINTLDATSSGFAEAFQPTITLPAHSKGYAEFSIAFVIAGTSTPLTQTEVPVTPIDVDGEAGKVYEFDDIYRSASSYVDYNMVGGELQISHPAANMVEGINTAGISYGGVDTTAKGVMFTVVNSNTSTLVIRVGADNKSNQSQQRLRSLYFQKFNYPSSVLDKPSIQSEKKEQSASRIRGINIFPTIVQNKIRVNIYAEKSGIAILKLVDYSGRILKAERIITQKGNNNISVNNFDNVAPGNYIVIINFENKIINHKIIKQ